jgi:hypothetical protein
MIDSTLGSAAREAVLTVLMFPMMVVGCLLLALLVYGAWKVTRGR